jgi:hypothetical protein
LSWQTGKTFSSVSTGVTLRNENYFSIEERMLAIQEKKRDLMTGAFGQSDNQRRQQRIQDIRDIFGL